MNLNFFTKENLQKYLSPEGLERALLIANLQDILMGLEKSNLELICDSLIKSNFLSDPELIPRLVANIFICCKYREFYVDHYTILIYSLYHIIQTATKIREMVNFGLQKRETLNESFFTFKYLANKNSVRSFYLTQKNEEKENVVTTSRRKSLVLSNVMNVNNEEDKLNEEENKIVSLIAINSNKTVNEHSKSGIEQDMKNNFENEFLSNSKSTVKTVDDQFFENFVMKSDSIMRIFRNSVFTINYSATKQPWRLYCVYRCMVLFNERQIYEYIESFYNEPPTIEFEHMFAFAYFAPLIKNHFVCLYEKLRHEMNKKFRYTHLPYSFNEFLQHFDECDASNWKEHDLILENCGFRPDTPQYAIRHDDVNFFNQQKNFVDVNTRIKKSVFIRYPMLKNRCTLIQLAAYYGSEKCFMFLLENGADVGLEDDIGLNVMHFAVVGGNHSIIVVLQKMGLMFDVGTIALVAECYRLPLFQWLLSVTPVNIEESYLQTGTIIHRAASANNVLVILFCISNGVSVNVFDNLELTPLFYAATNCAIDAIDVLLAHKDVVWSLADKFADTPLHGAAKSGDCDSFNAIMKHKDADINVKDFRHKSSVKYAAGEGCYDVFKMAIEKYADTYEFNEMDDEGQTMGFSISFSGFLNCFISFCNCQKFDLNIPRNDGYYLIHFIVSSNKVDFVRAFLSQERADPNVKLSDGTTSLHIAARKGFQKIVQILIDNKKTDLNVKDKSGLTPLHIAIRHVNTDIVRILWESERIDQNVTVVLFFFFFIHNGVLLLFFFFFTYLAPLDFAKLLGYQEIIDIIMNKSNSK